MVDLCKGGVASLFSSEKEAAERFAEASRSAAFSLSVGIREIRLLADRPWQRMWHTQPTELAALKKLIDKGLVVQEVDQLPVLTEAGRVVRELLVLSRHILLPDVFVPGRKVLEALAAVTAAASDDVDLCGAVVNGTGTDTRLVVSLRGANGVISDWELPIESVRRVG